MRNTLRCVICDKVNNDQVQNNIGDFIGKGWGDEGRWFFPDPNDKLDFICIECKIVIDNCRDEYHYMDMARQERELNALIDEVLEIFGDDNEIQD